MPIGRSKKINPNAAVVDAGGGKMVTLGSIKQKLGLVSTSTVMGYGDDVVKLQEDVASGRVSYEDVARALEKAKVERGPRKPITTGAVKGVKGYGNGAATTDIKAMRDQRLAMYANRFDPESLTPNDYNNLNELVNTEIRLYLITEQLDDIYKHPKQLMDQANNIVSLEKLAGELVDRSLSYQKALQIDSKTLADRKGNTKAEDQFLAFVKEGARWLDQYSQRPIHCGHELADVISFHDHPRNSITLWCPRCESMVTVGLKSVGIAFDPNEKDEDGKPKVVWLEQAKLEGVG